MVYLAKDSDFKNEYEEWIYIGSEKEVEIPEYIDGKLVTSTANMFNSLANATIVNKVVLKHNNVTDMNGMFMCYSSSQPLDLSTFDTSKVTDMSGMFNGYSSSQPLDLANLNTTNVTNMSGMFEGYSSSQPLDLSTFDTSKVTNMSSMFNGCSSLTSLDLSNLDLSSSNAKNVSVANMLDGCISLKEVYARTKEDAERLKAQATGDGISPKFYIVEREYFKIALGNNKIESVCFKDKNGKLNELKIYRENITELQ